MVIIGDVVMKTMSSMKQGKSKGASSSDASTKMKMSPSVDSSPDRGAKAAKTPGTIGPRTA